jgi:high-affinity iron transporter
MFQVGLLLVLTGWGPSPALAADPSPGRAIYVAKCQACHGEAGKGDGPAAAALPKPPPDMTTGEFWANMTDERLRSTIQSGKPSGVMRPFPMQAHQLDDLVAYLHTLQP